MLPHELQIFHSCATCAVAGGRLYPVGSQLAADLAKSDLVGVG